MVNMHTAYRRKNFLVSMAQYELLIIGEIIMLFPYLWMLSTSLKAPGTWYNFSLSPRADQSGPLYFALTVRQHSSLNGI